MRCTTYNEPRGPRITIEQDVGLIFLFNIASRTRNIHTGMLFLACFTMIPAVGTIDAFSGLVYTLLVCSTVWYTKHCMYGRALCRMANSMACCMACCVVCCMLYCMYVVSECSRTAYHRLPRSLGRCYFFRITAMALMGAIPCGLVSRISRGKLGHAPRSPSNEKGEQHISENTKLFVGWRHGRCIPQGTRFQQFHSRVSSAS